ncbi:MAG: methyltransferase domain-containing protein [Chloroflexi bacterium AL-W]|nr:methyltransferase domain-containing protein [Chloroflexi bacterium AL-N1]NOK65107.1 methyltransferase domain-containing protein [Chloroflexi bacterium AL-N10]NOK72626.1 methyltransferase domain-containing protein [Chloroflexi bacterium AL-N5]NOK79286.1 methyltransferase domain-containing protein [Chloroflexi bacterium AL-W]NOK87202.1 methyltransferase domain-containing protein [Chloroflexi bacterium AL-N15]
MKHIPPSTFYHQDWVALWQTMYDQEREQAERITSVEFTSSDCWSGQSLRFAKAAQRVAQPDHFMRFLVPHLRATDTLIDIGAGTGRYELFLAQAVEHVYAVEPSTSMCKQLVSQVTAAQLDNVTVLDSSWPDTDIATCDISIAVNVLYGVREIEAFIRQMHAKTRRSCFIVLGFQHPASFIGPFWEQFHGEPRYPLPGALECFNVLYQMGMLVNLTVIPRTSRFRFEHEQEALADLRWRLRLSKAQVSDTVLLDAMAKYLDRDEHGHLSPRNQRQHVAVIWWTHN